MQAVEDDRRRLVDKLTATESAGYSFMSEKLARLEAEVAAQQAQLQNERAHNVRWGSSLSKLSKWRVVSISTNIKSSQANCVAV